MSKRHLESQHESLFENGSQHDYDTMHQDWLNSLEYQKLVESGELSPKITINVSSIDLPF